MNIGLACDHAGYSHKEKTKKYLEELGYNLNDYGCFSEESVDYPDFAHQLANSIKKEINSHKKKLSLRYGLIKMDRTITGYLKGNYNDTSDKFETFDGKTISNWNNFSWSSKHYCTSITIPNEFISKINGDIKNSFTSDFAKCSDLSRSHSERLKLGK